MRQLQQRHPVSANARPCLGLTGGAIAPPDH
nr:MAG TPA: hypothetical protein [Caudoviricetes sp.]